MNNLEYKNLTDQKFRAKNLPLQTLAQNTKFGIQPIYIYSRVGAYLIHFNNNRKKRNLMVQKGASFSGLIWVVIISCREIFQIGTFRATKLKSDQ
jgi:hypothetical protein